MKMRLENHISLEKQDTELIKIEIGKKYEERKFEVKYKETIKWMKVAGGRNQIQRYGD